MSQFVDAVLVRRFAGECEDCGNPVAVIDDVVPLGTVLSVDLATRQKAVPSMMGGHRANLEVIVDKDGRLWPTSILMREGHAL